jgi:hypothetical protein
VVGNYNDDENTATIGSTPDKVTASEGLQVALGMAMWGFG